MQAYTWPGNIRELQNVIEYAFAVGEGSVLSLEDLTPERRGEAPEERLVGEGESPKIAIVIDDFGYNSSDVATGTSIVFARRTGSLCGAFAQRPKIGA